MTNDQQDTDTQNAAQGSTHRSFTPSQQRVLRALTFKMTARQIFHIVSQQPEGPMPEQTIRCCLAELRNWGVVKIMNHPTRRYPNIKLYQVVT